MKAERFLLAFLIFLIFMSSGCAAGRVKAVSPKRPGSYEDVKKKIVSEFASRKPSAWGENINGVVTSFGTGKKLVALTFDACGGPRGSGYDKDIIDFLIRENVPATLFINSRWIDANPEVFALLSRSKLFEIENHGLMHKPCSSCGNSAYNIEGTADINEMVDEIELNAEKIQKITGNKPIFYRPGTANCDDICIDVAAALGCRIIGFSINGDYGATADIAQVESSLISAKPGDIILMHMNHPEGNTFEGLMLAVPELKAAGFGFVKLSDVMGKTDQSQNESAAAE